MSTNLTMLHPMRTQATTRSGWLLASFLTLFLSLFQVAQAQELFLGFNDQFICQGQSVQIFPAISGGQPPYTYSWSPDSGLSCTDCLTPTATPTITTTYGLTVTDFLGAQATGGIVITVLEAVEFDISVVSLPCNGFNNGIISVSAVGGEPPFLYQWSNGFVGSSQGNLAAGTYCITLTSASGCTATDCVTLTNAPSFALTADVQDASCGSTADGSISVAVSGGIPPYAYNWSNGANTQTINQLAAGRYILTVTDSNGCTGDLTVEVGNVLDAVAQPETAILCQPDAVLLQGSSSASGPNIVFEWTGPNGLLVNNADVLASIPGYYTLKVTDTNQADCYTTDQTEVLAFDNIIVDSIRMSLVACNVYELSAILPPNYFGPIEFEWIFPDGSSTNTVNITTVQTGVYQLYTRIPGAPCESHVSQFIDAEAQNCATITGRLAQDDNQNCVVDDEETGLNDWVVKATNGAENFFAITQADGGYTFHLPLGQYTLSSTSPTPSWELCQPNPVVNLLNAGETQTANLSAQAIEECPELSVVLSSPFLRRCFTSDYYIYVTNIGTAVAESAVVNLQLDEWLTYLNASIPGSVNGQSISWNLFNLEPGESAFIWVHVLVNCNAMLGQVHCSEVSAQPDVLCRPTEATWSGASLKLQGICDGDEVRFVVSNDGTGDLLEPVSYIVVEDAVMMMQAPGTLNSLPSGDEQIYTFPANGSTYTFRIDQAPSHPYDELSPTVVVEGCGLNTQGTFSTGWTDQFPLQTTTLSSAILCLPNQGAYDPNDKQALPKGYGPNHYVEAADLINYRIRFQNTGTDTAFTVVVRDELSNWLDLATLRPGTSSHPYRAEIQNNRTLVFTFDNIRLPDSTTNLEGSQGFIDFSIRSLRETPLETRVENNAAIYFDFNEPVITNTVFHTVGEAFIEIINWIGGPDKPTVEWRVFPNPTPRSATLELISVKDGLKTVVISSLQGRELWRQPFQGNQVTIDAALASGLYLIQLFDANGQPMGQGKLVVR